MDVLKIYKRFEDLLRSGINHDGFKRYLGNTVWTFAEQFLRIFSGLFVGVWVSRYLGPEKFGLLSYAMAFTAVFSNIAKLGLDTILVQRLAHNSKKHDVYMGTAFWMKLFASGLTFLVMAFILLSNRDLRQDAEYILIIGLGIFFQSFEVIDFYYQSQVRSKIPSILKMVQLVSLAVLRIFLIIVAAQFAWFILAILLDQIMVSFLLYGIYVFNKDGYFINKFDKRIALSLLKKSWPLMVNGLIVIMYMRLDQLMIKEMLGDLEVGIYSAAVRLCEASYFIPMVIVSSLFPAIINARKSSKKIYYSRLQKLYVLQVWLSLSIILIVSLSASWIVNLLYGSAYSDAGPVLIVNIWALLFVFFGVVKGRWMVLENMQFYATINALVGLCINVVFNLILIPRYGVTGAALGTLAAQFFSAIVIPVFSKKDRISISMFFNAFIFRGMHQK